MAGRSRGLVISRLWVANQHHGPCNKGEGVDVIQRQRRTMISAASAPIEPILTALVNMLAIRQMGHMAPFGHTGGATGALQHRDVAIVRRGVLLRLLAMAVQDFTGLRQMVRRHHLLHVLDHGVDQQTLRQRGNMSAISAITFLTPVFGSTSSGQVGHVVYHSSGAGVVEFGVPFPRGVQRAGIDHDQPARWRKPLKPGYCRRWAVARRYGRRAANRSAASRRQRRRTTRTTRRNGWSAQVAERWFVGKRWQDLFQYRLNIRVLVRIDFGRNPQRDTYPSKVFVRQAAAIFIAFNGVYFCLFLVG